MLSELTNIFAEEANAQMGIAFFQLVAIKNLEYPKFKEIFDGFKETLKDNNLEKGVKEVVDFDLSEEMFDAISTSINVLATKELLESISIKEKLSKEND